ncbi:hypothetical protein CSQ90_06690 [Janthinobacterium sp. BJB303]|nr:hypothetical protein CSQ90_06690 [Janthinobacterium sp. BJB303]
MPLHHHLRSTALRLRRGLSFKGAAVALILAMHALGLYFLLLPARQLKQYTEVAFMTLLPPRPMPRTPPMALPMPMPGPRFTAPAAPRPLPPAPAPAETAPATAEAITMPTEPAPAVPADDLRTRARLAAGTVDRALRAELKKDKPWLAAPEFSGDSAFQKLAASAWRGGPIIRVEEYQTADGRPVTRVVSAGGAACYGLDANPGAGADPGRTGGKVKRVPCPG